MASNSDVEETDNGTGYVLVHRRALGVVGQTPPGPRLFEPLKIVHPVTYLGRLPGNDVVLPSTNVSRRHAKLIVTDLGVTIHDLDSHNGIFLNGKKVRSTPVSPGDLVYIGDVCVELQRGDSDVGGSTTAVVHSDISDEDDPRARGLAALMRVSEIFWRPILRPQPARPICGGGGDDLWATDVLQICREFVAASTAALVQVRIDGDLEPAVVLRSESVRDAAAPVRWEVVQKAIASEQAQDARDIDSAQVGGAEAAAVLAIPLLVPDVGVVGAIYLSRTEPAFSDVEFETLLAISRLVGLRLERSELMSLEAPSETAKLGDDLMAARARLTIVEELLSAEQSKVSRLAQGVQNLDTENFKLRQQFDLTSQALEKQTADRELESFAQAEAALLEQKKQQDLAGVRVALQTEIDRQRLELEKQAEASRVIEHRAAEAETQTRRRVEAEAALTAAQGAHEQAETRLAAVEVALAHARDQLSRVQANEAVLAARSAIDAQRSAELAYAGQLRSALRASVLPTLVDHAEAVAAGEALATPAHARLLTVVYLALADFDAFSAKVSVDDVKLRLDRFCMAVAARVPANGGRVDQIIGHGHLLVFAADPASVVGAIRCALEVAAIVDAGAGPLPGIAEPAVVAGVHTGVAIAGFFGDADGVSYVEAGVPVVVARAAIDHAPPGKDGVPRGVVVSEAVQAIIAADGRFHSTRLGSVWIKGAGAPVSLALVDVAGGAG